MRPDFEKIDLGAMQSLVVVISRRKRANSATDQLRRLKMTRYAKRLTGPAGNARA
jgi:hypothetical protein